jgi:hypothetical protein
MDELFFLRDPCLQAGVVIFLYNHGRNCQAQFGWTDPFPIHRLGFSGSNFYLDNISLLSYDVLRYIKMTG